MYLKDTQTNLEKILQHIYEITNFGGNFFGTFTGRDSHITKNATCLNSNIIKVKDEYYKFREGQLYHIHISIEEVEFDLKKVGFKDINVYEYNVNWFGTKEHLYIFNCKK